MIPVLTTPLGSVVLGILGWYLFEMRARRPRGKLTITWAYESHSRNVQQE